MGKAELLALAERVEGAAGPSDELDLEIARASYAGLLGNIGLCGYSGRVNYDPAMWLERHGPITGSLDSAMGLVPEGWNWALLGEPDGYKVGLQTRPGRPFDHAGAHAATPALALTAAALRAIAAERGE